jgi:tripartite motif-containing protein 71
MVVAFLTCLLAAGCDALIPTASPSPNPGSGSNPTPTPSSSPSPSIAPSPSPIASPSISYAYDSKFGSSGSGNSQFNSPYGIAIDADNYLYVVDSANGRVQKFNTTGGYQTQWATLLSGETSASHPTDIAVGTVGSSTGIFVLDAGTEKLKAFFTTGGPAGSIDGSVPAVGFVAPAGLCATGSNYYITDAARCCVQVFSLAGSLSATYSCNVAGGGATQAANGLAVIPGEAIFVADEMGRVKKFGTT